MSDLKLSLCITNYNRTTMLLESFEKVLDDPRISEIIICDDGSSDDVESFLKHYIISKLSFEYYGKVRLMLHSNNLGMYENKKRAIEYASNEWCILFDSDNIIDSSYIDAFEKDCLYSIDGSLDTLFKSTIYCPSFAAPQFWYESYADGTFYGRREVKQRLHDPEFECLLNTCNYIVNREEYLRIWQPAPNIQAADSIYFMYLWLEEDNDFYVVPAMKYEHRIHDGSGFMQDVNGNMQKAKHVKELIKYL